jgi:HAD superfamily hydrolase (TIGR01509 family)
MIKLIIFDLDGVLIDAREIHYESLNRAISLIGNEFIINKEEHLSIYDGLPTKQKLDLLSKNKNLPKDKHNLIWENKQRFTIEVIKETVTEDEKIKSILKELKQNGYKIYVASNSIKETIKIVLLKKGFLEYIDNYYSNEDVKNPKPNSEIYLKCMIDAGVNPDECLIIEDSIIGRKAALKAGGHLHPVLNTNDICLNKIMDNIDKINKNKIMKIKWKDNKMKVLIPMAGAGTRFEKAGYTFPKPLIEIRKKPMIQVVVDSLGIEAQYIFIVQKNHYEKYNLKNTLNLICPNCEIVLVDTLTEGAACTTLLAKNYINNDDPLLIANSDQYVNWDSNEFMYSMMADNIDAGILVFESTHPKWSYAKLDDNGFVCEVAEKKSISNLATVGIYFWKKGSDYVKYAEQMISKNIRVNNEFYVCPVFNQAIQDEKKIKIFKIENNKMWGIGTPEDLDYFIKNNKEEL